MPGETKARPRKAAPSKGAAARAEAATDPAAKTIQFGGQTLNLPDSLPETILFDITELEASEGDPMPIYRMLRSVLDKEQFTLVRNEIGRMNGAADGAVDRLLGDIFEQYGISLGESSASPDS